jgi:nondiscriminating aspartyl-tRNA synthetase
MDVITAATENQVTSRTISSHAGQRVTVRGAIHRVRRVGPITFVVLRDRDGLLQGVLEAESPSHLIDSCEEGNFVVLGGMVAAEERAPHGVDLRIDHVEVVGAPVEPFPFVMSKRVLNVGLNEKLNYRMLSLRHPREQAIFRIQAVLAELFERYLSEHGFTAIHTPKIVSAGAEGGANLFPLEYFGRQAFLAQSPQFYKQFMVGVFERVYEVGPVYRAERHATSRHLNEYVSMDYEMGFIADHRDVMAVEVALLTWMFDQLRELCAEDLALLEVEVPSIGDIPTVTLAEAQAVLAQRYDHDIQGEGDLDPRGEELLSQWTREQCGSEFVFVTAYPSAKRPFYAMDDPEAPHLTRSFDLLFRGLEVTTGGQRIHRYDEQLEKIRRFGLSPESFESYLLMHKFGMPPHGGLAIGLERLTMRLLGRANIRDATLFPRDIDRITP